MRIRLENIFRTVGGAKILDDASAFFESGQANVVIGPNGSGKTTLLKTIALLEKSDRGEIFFDDKPVSSTDFSQRLSIHRRIGFSFQNPIFFRTSVEENLVYGLKVRGGKPSSDKIASALGIAGLAGKEKLQAEELSGGEKQRLSMARAAITEPDCYIFDEPTANLDPVGAKAVEKMMSDISDKGKTMIVTTHNMAQARKLGGNIFFMNKGRIEAGADADIFFRKPVSLKAAEYSFAENVFEGDLEESDGGTFFLRTGGIKIEVAASGQGESFGRDNGEKSVPGKKVYGVLRSEDIFVSLAPIVSSARNSFEAIVENISPMGPIYVVEALSKGVRFETVVTKQSVESLNLKKGLAVYLTFKATAVHILPG
ncbi:MAG: ABC transporter ATP-binding protein [Endomicrobiia bacterium]|nr:ABC transporter ATP-binding protein [Endomicrobiia bacterium]